MTRMTVAAIALAAGLGAGLVIGAAGTIVAKDSAAQMSVAQCTEHMQAMGGLMSGGAGMMSGSGMMGGAAGTGSGMMGGSAGMGPGMMSGASGTGMMGSGASAMPEWMLGHHGFASPEPAP